ncbi:hypothetical protein G6F54_013766 [Rhizopus delemar]|nr:hypothetical protein G6F54_013766 [Rhizopus delemar]
MRHAVLEHPAVARAVRDDLVQGVRVHAFAQAQRHRLGGGRDVHASQQLVGDLDLAARTGAVAQAIDLAGHRFQHRAAGLVGGGATGGHHRHLAGSGLGRATGDGRVQVQHALLGQPRFLRDGPAGINGRAHHEHGAGAQGGGDAAFAIQHGFG